MSEMPPLVRQRQTCIECGMPAIARRLCRKHYDKAYSSIVRPKPARTLVDRGEIDRLTAEVARLRAGMEAIRKDIGLDGCFCSEYQGRKLCLGCALAALLGETTNG